MTPSSPGMTRAVWWFFLVILTAHATLVVINIVRTAQNESQVTHTYQVLNLLHQLQSSLIDTETSVRGFLITGSDQFLEPYRSALPVTPHFIDNLTRLTDDNPNQQAALANVHSLVEHRLTLLRDLIEMRRRPARDAAAEVELVSQGKRVMDQLRELIGGMSAEERKLLEERRQFAQTALTTSLYSTAGGGAITIGLLLLSSYLIRRQQSTRRRGEELVRASEARFRVLSDAMPQLVWSAKTDGQFDFVNQQWIDFTGRSADKSLGNGWRDVIHPADRTDVDAAWKRTVATGQFYLQELRLRRHDQHYVWFLIRALPLADKRGHIVQWIGTCTDIDEQKRAKDELEIRVRQRTQELSKVVSELNSEMQERIQAGERLEKMADELGRCNRELEQFAYVASHDLQEPLRKIQAFGDRLRLQCADSISDQGKEYLERMLTSAGRMRRLIDDLLSLSRVTTRTATFQDVDLNEAAADAVNDLEDALQRTGGRIDIGPLPTIFGDPMQMRQLFLNLLSNALKFYRPGVPPVVSVQAESVETGGRTADGPTCPAIQITVADNGIGFDPAYSERIFQVFQRLHGRGVYEGTGIGLAVVRRIVERHGGTITASAMPDQGAAFTIVLPVHSTDDSEAPAAQDVATTVR